MTATHATDAVLAAIDDDLDTARAELETLVRIPSISADPEHIRRRARVRRRRRRAHGRVRPARRPPARRSTAGIPYVVGEWNARADGAPTVLLYAHHDVQPPGYVDRWTSDPFEPREVDGRLFGRGTADDKAGAVAHLAAVRAWLRAAGALPVQREGAGRGRGGDRLARPRPVPRRARRASWLSDVLLLADAGNWTVGVPGLTYSLRGLAGVDVRLRALDSPLHSGMAGGAVPDPVQALAKLLATLTDEHGDPAFDGCWDDYAAARRRRARPARGACPRTSTRCAPRGGCATASQLTGDPARSMFERLWLRPVVTVIGIDGHPIAGSSNQIVAEADARVSVRVGRGPGPGAA